MLAHSYSSAARSNAAVSALGMILSPAHGDTAEDNPHLEPTEPASSRSAIEPVRNLHLQTLLSDNPCMEEDTMDGLIYLIGLIVVIMAILSLFGLR
jgi:hypothetical protein